MSLETEFFSGGPTTVTTQGHTFHRHSNLTAVLDHARKETGRNAATGQIVYPNKTGSWLGNVAYLIMVDMLATIFYTLPSGQGGNKAKYTGFLVSNGLPQSEAEVIYELRCSLAHEFGLVNKPNRIFTVVANPTTPMITPPSDLGPLPFGSIQPQHVTVVNLELVAQKLDALVTSMKTAAGTGNLVSVLTPAEFSDRFFFHVGPMS